MNILVTGAAGFLGKNLVVSLRRDQGGLRRVIEITRENLPYELDNGLREADIVFHLAGVNRPTVRNELSTGNVDLTRYICDKLLELDRTPTLVLASSTQATLNNDYGRSKYGAELIVKAFAHKSGARVLIFRLPGVFGKWCRPNYNSVVATFCHNVARDVPISVNDASRELTLVYIDDLVETFLKIVRGISPPELDGYCTVEPHYRITLGALADTLRRFRKCRTDLVLPDMSDPLVRALYATYVSYLPEETFAYPLTVRIDTRGELAEIIKSPHVGQFFLSRTRPGITRGNHYHDKKVEKFLVVDGDALIRFRHILNSNVIEYPVSGKDMRVVDIPTGYTHSIENVGKKDLIVLFWSDEIFDPKQPDTIFDQVLK